MAVAGLDPGIGPGHPEMEKRCASIHRDPRHKARDDAGHGGRSPAYRLDNPPNLLYRRGLNLKQDAEIQQA
jgi:hypothetical protein